MHDPTKTCCSLPFTTYPCSQSQKKNKKFFGGGAGTNDISMNGIEREMWRIKPLLVFSFLYADIELAAESKDDYLAWYWKCEGFQ